MKKFLTSLLCVVLIVCFMPAMAWAGSDAPCDDGDGCQHAAAIITEAGTTTHYNTLQEAITASNSGDKIQLLKDIDNSIAAEGYTGALSFELKENTTLDGNEHKISGHVGIRIPAQGATVQNINFENIHNGVVVDEATCEYYGWDNKTGNQSAIYASSLTGTATITGCTFDNIDWDAIQITPKAETSKIIIKDNTFKHTDENSTQLRYIHIEDIRYNKYSGSKVAEVTITDNQFYKSKNSYETCSIGTWYISASKTPEVKINGNYIEDLNSTEVSRLDIKNLYPARSKPDVDEDDLNPAAYYSSNVYMTLQDAIDKGENYIYLMQDNTENVNIPEGRTISLYSGSYKLDGKITNNGGLTVDSGTNTQGNATVTNNGVLTLSCDAAASYDVINTNNGTLKITDGETYDLSKIQNSGSVEISGGTFKTKPDDSLLCEWYLAKELENGSYKVSKMTIEEGLEKGLAASTVAGAFYKSVNEAVVGSRGNIYLQKDSSEDVVFNAGNTTRSLYLNGKDFTGSIQISDPCDAVRLCGSSAELSNVTGKTLYIGSYNTEAQVTIRNADLETLNVAASGQCNVKGGTYKNVITNIYYEENAETPKYEASLQITGGTFASNTVTVSYVNHTLEDGSKAKTVPLSDFLPENYTIAENSDGTYTVVPPKTTITFSYGGEEQKVVVDANGPIPTEQIPAFSKPGYILSGWKTQDGNWDMTGEVGTEDFTLEPVWTLSAPTIVINADKTSTYVGGVINLTAVPKHAITGLSYTYQWHKDGKAIAGAVNSTLSVKDGGSYTVKVMASDGTLDSAQAESRSILCSFYSANSGSTSDALAADRNTAMKDLESYVNLSDYDIEEQAVIKTIIDNAQIGVKQASTKEAIGKIVSDAKASIDTVLTSAEKTEQIAAADSARIKAGVQATTLKIYSKSLNMKGSGKGWIQVRWVKSKGFKVDGYELYRGKTKSTMKRYDTTTKTTYTNKNYLKKGSRYYYKVRGYRMINGEKVYTQWSKTIYRLAK